MSGEQERRAHRKASKEDQEAEPARTEKQQSAEEVSASTEKLLDEVDDVLNAQLGFEKGETPSEEEITKAAEELVRNYVQKGGQ